MSDIPEPDESFWSYRNPILYGFAGTAMLGFVYWYLATSRSCQKGICQTNFDHFLSSSPNEIGDTLAGIAGILAFLWIIITVFLQSKELKDARKEYNKMASAQEEQVRLLVHQGKIFELEQKERVELATDREVDALVKELLSLVARKISGRTDWYNHMAENPFQGSSDVRSISVYVNEDTDFETRTFETISQLKDEIEKVLADGYALKAVHKPENKSEFDRLSEVVSRISKVANASSPSTKSFLRSVELATVEGPLQSLLSEPTAWSEAK